MSSILFERSRFRKYIQRQRLATHLAQVDQARRRTAPSEMELPGPMEQLEPRQYMSASVSGTVFADLDEDGNIDAGEIGLRDWVVFRDENENDARDEGEAFATTNAIGQFTLNNLPAGAHAFGLERPAGWSATTPALGVLELTLTADQSATGAKFGNAYSPVEPSPINESELFTLDFSDVNLTDVEVDHWEIDWGDGSDPETVAGSAAWTTHRYLDGFLSKYVMAVGYDDEDNIVLSPDGGDAGQLDTSFDSDGKVITNLGGSEEIVDVAVQSDGKLVAIVSDGSGDFVVVRYLANGSLDSSFSGDGKTSASFGGTESVGAVAIQSDGKIIVVGSASNGTDYDVAVARFLADGTLDTSFGSSGKTLVDFGGWESGIDVAIGADDSIAVAAYGGTGDFAAAKLTDDGAMDTSFSSDGKVTTDINGSSDSTQAIAIQSDGKLLLSGMASGTWQWTVARYTESGALDETFGDGGVSIGGPVVGWIYAMAVRGDGTIALAGGGNEFQVAQFTSAGVLDTAFSDDGVATIDFTGNTDVAYDVAFEPDGKVVVAGAAYGDFAIARYGVDGSLDEDFDSDGKLVVSLAAGADYARALAIQPDAHIVVAGVAYPSGYGDLALVRVQPGLVGVPVLVRDVAPTIEIDGDDALLAGELFTLSVAVSDPGDDDVTGMKVHWGDGTFTTYESFVASPTHTFSAVGDFEVIVTLMNGDGSFESSAHEVAVDGVAISGAATVREGHVYELTVSARNFDVSSMTIDWGDGNVDVIDPVTSLPDVFEHTYADGLANHTILVTATDGEDEHESNELAVTVQDVAPVLTLSGDGSVTEGVAFELSLQWEDVEGDPVERWKVYWGDGTISLYEPGDDNPLSVYHIYADGNSEHFIWAEALIDGQTFASHVGGGVGGALDETFSTDGIALTHFGSYEEIVDVAVQSDGKIVAAVVNSSGDFIVVRYLANGSLDTSFGVSGKATADFGGYENAEAIALQSDGSILVAGLGYGAGYGSSGDAAVVRFDQDGDVDSSFGDGGIRLVDFGSWEVAKDIAVGPNDEIAIAAYGAGDFCAALLTPDGDLDTSFSTDGKATTDIRSAWDSTKAVAFAPDGKIVVAGVEGYGGAFAAVRYNADGSLDTTFDSDGKNWGDNASGWVGGVAVQSDGKVIVAGTDNSDFMLLRFNENGSRDNSFGSDGDVHTDIAGGTDTATAIALQADGKIVTVGYTYGGGEFDYSLTRHHTDGTLDNSFDGDGKLVIDVGGANDYAKTVAVQNDGYIVVAGYSYVSSQYDLSLVRIEPGEAGIVVSVIDDGDTVQLGGSVEVTEGDTYYLALAVTGVTADTVEIDWGDGLIQTVDGDEDVVTHTYLDGNATVNIVATAFVGVTEYTSDPITISVANAPPKIQSYGYDPVLPVEGQPVTVWAEVTDAGVLDDHTATIDFGDGTEVVATILRRTDGTMLVRATHIYSQDGTFDIAITVRDKDGDEDTVTIHDMEVADDEPTISVTGDSDVEAGVVYTIYFSENDPGGDEVVQWRVNWGDGSEVETFSGSATQASHTFMKVDAFNIVVEAVYDDGHIYAGLHDVTVHLPPEVSIAISGLPVTPEGDDYDLELINNGLEIDEWVIDWGDGSAPESIDGDLDSATHQFPDGPNTHQITVSITMFETQVQATMMVNVTNVAPTITSITVDPEPFNHTYLETDFITFTIAFEDPGDDTFDIIGRTHLNDIEFFVTPGTGPGQYIATWGGNFDDGAYLMHLITADDDGGWSAEWYRFFSQIVSPSVQILSPVGTYQGKIFSITLDGIVENDDPDTVTHFRIDWGDGTPIESIPAVDGLATEAQHIYTTIGTHKVRVTPFDDDRFHFHKTEEADIIVIEPDLEEVVIFGSSTVYEGATYILNLWHDNYHVEYWDIDWGDGTTSAVNGDSTTIQHIYADSGDYTINAVASIGGDEYELESIDVDVQNVDPDIDYELGSVKKEDLPFSIYVRTTDPGREAFIAGLINWGDGSTSPFISDSEVVSHVYNTPDTYSISIEVDNEDGNSVESGIQVVIASATTVAPSSASATALSTEEVKLQWSNGNADVVAYVIGKREGSSGGYTYVTTIDRYADSYVVRDLEENTPYWFQIAAVNSNGTETPSETSATTMTGYETLVSGYAYVYGYVPTGYGGYAYVVISYGYVDDYVISAKVEDDNNPTNHVVIMPNGTRDLYIKQGSPTNLELSILKPDGYGPMPKLYRLMANSEEVSSGVVGGSLPLDWLEYGREFVVVMGLDKDADGVLDEDEELFTAAVHVVSFDTLTVTDTAAEWENKVESEADEPDEPLIVEVGADGLTSITLQADYLSNASAAGERIYWDVRRGEDGPSIHDGTFSTATRGITLPLDPSAPFYTVVAGFDADFDGVLDAGEIQHSVEIQLVRVKTLAVEDSDFRRKETKASVTQPEVEMWLGFDTNWAGPRDVNLGFLADVGFVSTVVRDSLIWTLTAEESETPILSGELPFATDAYEFEFEEDVYYLRLGIDRDGDDLLDTDGEVLRTVIMKAFEFNALTVYDNDFPGKINVTATGLEWVDPDSVLMRSIVGTFQHSGIRSLEFT